MNIRGITKTLDATADKAKDLAATVGDKVGGLSKKGVAAVVEAENRLSEVAQQAGHRVEEAASVMSHRVQEAAQRAGNAASEIVTKVEHKVHIK